MSAKRVRKSQNVSDKLLNPDRREIWRTIAWGFLILALCVGVLSVAFRARQQLNPQEYEGKIVDKWTGYHHTDEGSFPYFRLVLETNGEQKVTVAIDPDNYQLAKVGMRISKTSAGIEMRSDEPSNNNFRTDQGRN